MDEPSELAATRERFPFVAAVFCAACVGVAVWLWMKYSYCWEMTPGQLRNRMGNSAFQWPNGAFVRVGGQLRRGRARIHGTLLDLGVRRYHVLESALLLLESSRGTGWVYVIVPDRLAEARWPSEVRFTGRVGMLPWTRHPGSEPIAVDTTCSRWTGQSVAGLAVGAMGLLVFGTAFGDWRKRRRPSRRDAAEAST